MFHGGSSLRSPSVINEKIWEAPDMARRTTELSTSTIKAGFGRPSAGRRFSKTSTFASTSTGESHGIQRPFSITTDKTTASRASVMKPVRGPRGKGTEFVKAELPALVLYTECNSRYTFIHLTLDPGIYVNPAACKCRKEKSNCRKVVLESKNSRFTMRTLSADEKGENGLNSWDLSVFRFPRSEKWKKAIANDGVKTLELEFSSVEERILFIDELTLLEDVRTTDHNDYQTEIKQKMKKEKRRW